MTEKKAETLSHKERLLKGLVQHRPGSRKAKIHECFDKQGDEAAEKLSKKLAIKLATYKAWRRDWLLLQQVQKKKAPAKKKAAVKRKSTKAA